MNKKIKILLSVIICFCILLAVIPFSVYSVRGNLSRTDIPEDFEKNISADVFENTADIRVMSSNLLVHYESWGGLPEKPRAKTFIEVLEKYKPDVVGLQELCDGWYCCLNRNLPDGYKLLYPFSTGVFVRMTAMVYNSDTLELIDSGNFKYEKGDNPRLRRVVWAVFEVKETGKRFAVTNTHFDLLREGREDELTEVMRSQTDELLNCVEDISEKYDCSVLSVGDFNSMEDTEYTKPIDIPEIYNTLADNLTDTKFVSDNKFYGTKQNWEYPSYDHIFLKGNATVKDFCIMSYDYLSDMSDHFPIFADIVLN